MYNKFVGLILALAIIGLAAPACQARVDWEVVKTLELPEAPIDMKVATNGQWIYVLTKKGDLLVYTAKGDLVDTLSVGKHIDTIDVGKNENTLYLQSSIKKSIQVLDLSYIREINITHSPFKGNADAPVVIADYTDFQCPYCAKMLPIFDELLELYPGKLKIVYKNFPLRRHSYAQKAAFAAMAAHQNGKFWEFHDRLFENYRKLDDKVIKNIRKELGLDTPEFKKLVNSSKIKSLVHKDLREGKINGVRGTPAIFINGKRLKNSRLQGFRKAIDKELESLGAK